MKIHARVPVLAAVVAAVVVAVLLVVPAAQAQDSGSGFLFQPPSGSFSLRGGFAMPNARSDLFSFTTSQFTVNHADFGAMDFGADLAFTLTSRWDLVFDVSYSGMSKGSEFRNFVDNNQQPIQQTTSFQRIPVTVNARYYLEPRGRQIGHFAWIPTSIAPYVGAGAGLMYYDFSQKGDFIDYTTLAVFPDAFQSSGWTPMGQVLAGVDWSLGPKWALRTEARYLMASAAPSGDFAGPSAGFHRIDLSGVTTSIGFFVRF